MKGGWAEARPTSSWDANFQSFLTHRWSWGEVREVAVGLKLLDWREGWAWVEEAMSL